ncbi:MAG: hypothetical protein Q7R83_03655 [bacterium]|nr:hypothetical protein [bacterium]
MERVKNELRLIEGSVELFIGVIPENEQTRIAFGQLLTVTLDLVDMTEVCSDEHRALLPHVNRIAALCSTWNSADVEAAIMRLKGRMTLTAKQRLDAKLAALLEVQGISRFAIRGHCLAMAQAYEEYLADATANPTEAEREGVRTIIDDLRRSAS